MKTKKTAKANDATIWVRITDENHPHYPKHGRLTGEVFRVLGQPMALMALSGEYDECFVSHGQVCETKKPHCA